MSGLSEQHVLAALRQVIDPDRGKDIVSLGMISSVQLREGHVGFAIEVDPQRGPKLEPLRKAAEKAVEALPGVLSVTAVLTAQKPAGTAAARPAQPQGHAHARGAAAKPLVPGVRSIIAVASGKGGVGKSTVAVNLALGLAAIGLRVGLLDADIYGPSMPRMLGVSGRPASRDGKVLQPMTNYGISCMSMGFLVAEDTPMIWRGPMVMSALQQMLRDVDWGELDVMVVDMPPGTGDAQLALAQTAPVAGTVVVTTPQDVSLNVARRGLAMFRQVQVPVLGVVENMSYFLCPHCGKRTDVFSHGGAKAEAERLGVPFLGEVPLESIIRETSDAGLPVVATKPDSPQAAIYREIAARVRDGLAQKRARAAPKIVIES